MCGTRPKAATTVPTKYQPSLRPVTKINWRITNLKLPTEEKKIFFLSRANTNEDEKRREKKKDIGLSLQSVIRS